MSEYKKYSSRRILINRISVILLLALSVALVIFVANGIKRNKINRSDNTVSGVTEPPASIPAENTTDIPTAPAQTGSEPVSTPADGTAAPSFPRNRRRSRRPICPERPGPRRSPKPRNPLRVRLRLRLRYRRRRPRLRRLQVIIQRFLSSMPAI